MPPTGTTSTRGTNTQPFWSISTLPFCAGHFAPAGAFSIQTTAFCTPRFGPSTRSSASFSLPQMYWSMVTGTLGRSGSAPL